MKLKFYAVISLLIPSIYSLGQCSVCTQTTANLDQNAASGINAGILYLAFLPITIIIIIGYQWRKHNNKSLNS